MIRISVYDRTEGEELLGSYQTLVVPRIGELVSFDLGRGHTFLRVEEVYHTVFPANGSHAFPSKPSDWFTIFGRQTTGPHA